MQQKSDPHIFSGMRRDVDVAKHKPEFLYDAHNIRFTAIDGDTLMAITNEKGTEEIELSDTILGVYLGHCVINNYVVVFTKGNNDNIYKVTDDGTVNLLYTGDLNFDLSHPIETLGVYENEKIQKVYWTDGFNQPRVINVCGEYNTTGKHINEQFDFIATLNLNETVTVERKEGSGLFAPGTIQYAFSYYNKYGRQSNIFYTTLLNYISDVNRGGKPDEKIANVFSITIDNLQVEDFDYLRVYSIHRTSYNTIPTVKRIIDIELSTVADSKKTMFVDDGTIGDTIDPSELLYIGGELIKAQTLTQKDNTIFLGNIEITRPRINEDYVNSIQAIGKTSNNLISVNETTKSYYLNDVPEQSDYYKYVSTMNGGVPGFKNREHYRLGVQFQHNSGKWSEPVFLRDYTLLGTNNPSIVEQDGMYILNQPTLQIQLNLQLNGSSSHLNGYKKVRPVVVFPTLLDRLVLTQGVLCPTVFSKKSRKDSSPFCQSSWFFRPFLPFKNNTISQGLGGTTGAYLAYRHLEPLSEGGRLSNVGVYTPRANEIQGCMEAVGFENTSIPKVGRVFPKDPPEDKQFFVDQSIVTMHSPDIEWDDEFKYINHTDWKLNILGASVITAVCSDINIQTSSPALNDAEGFRKVRYNTNNKYFSGGALISSFSWWDGIFTDDNYNYYRPNNDNDIDILIAGYLIYPWQRIGSLNNDNNRPSDKGERTAVLKEKKMSNLKFSAYNRFFSYGQNDNPNDAKYNISEIQLFSSDQVSLTKIPFVNKLYSNVDINYYGNVDTLLTGNNAQYVITESLSENDTNAIKTVAFYGEDVGLEYCIEQVNVRSTTDKKFVTGPTPVRMKYKSSKHLIFGLLPNDDQSVNILPRITEVADDSTGTQERGEYGLKNMFWVDQKYKDAAENNMNPESSLETVPTFVFDNVNKMNSLMGVVAAEDRPVILLEGGISGDNANAGPMLCTVTRSNSTYSVQTHPASASVVYAAEYWNHGDIDGTRYFTGDNESEYNYSVKEITNYQSGVVEDDETIYPFKITQRVLPSSNIDGAYLLLAELYKENPISWDVQNAEEYTYFGGKTKDAVKNNMWIPAGLPVDITDVSGNVKNSVTVDFTQGDTWYTRYDCLKTYPFTMDDENSVVEIFSFMCESRVNADGRWDKNRGQMSNMFMNNTNFNLFNSVYNNHDNFFNYRILDEDYYRLNIFNNQITWSKEKQNAADIDLYTNITLANTYDMDGTMGAITALETWKDTIFCFQDKAIAMISFNPRVQISPNDGVPIELSNSNKFEGKVYISEQLGCSNKQTICVTPNGVYFVDPNSRDFYVLLGKEVKNISLGSGFSNWFRHNTIDRVTYDNNRSDIYLINDSTSLVFSEVIGGFTSFMDYHNTPAMFNIKDRFFAFRNELYDNSPIVNMYGMFEGSYNTFFNVDNSPFWIEFISNPDVIADKTFSTVDLRLNFHDIDESEVADNITFFDKIRVYNDYQDTEEQTIHWNVIKPSQLKRKFRIWRVNVPRDSQYRLNRIRSTWAKFKFKKENPGDKKMILHDLNVQYFI